MTGMLSLIRALFPPSCHKRIFVTGGTARDILLGKPFQDIDLVAAIPHEVLVSARFRLVQPASAEPVYFQHHPKGGKIEVVRIENLEDLEQDLLRRDFTINAIAMDLDGQVIDPLAGRKDLAARILRPCSPRTFADDPLRIFRAFRFECDGWAMATTTAALITGSEWSAPLAAIPQERFTAEMQKALSGREPERFFRRMVDLEVGFTFCPYVFRMPLVPAGPPEHHPEGDLLTHSIQVLQRVAQMTEEPLPRFCAFFHDLGKLATDRALYPRHLGHEEAGAVLARELCRALRLSSKWEKALLWVSRLHGKGNRWHELRPGTKVNLAEDALRGGVEEILPMVAAADKGTGGQMKGWQEAVTAGRAGCAALGIDSETLTEMPVEKRRSVIFQKRVELFRLLQH